MRAYAILCVGDAPNSDEPLVKTERRILEDGSNLGGELLTAILVLALKHSPTGDVSDTIAAAHRASDLSVWPPYRDHVPMAHVQVREVANGFK